MRRGQRDRDSVTLCRYRHGHWYSDGGPREALSGVFAGGWLEHAPVWGHWAGAGDRQATRHHDGRAAWGREYTWPREYILVYRAMPCLHDGPRHGPGTRPVRAPATLAAGAFLRLSPHAWHGLYRSVSNHNLGERRSVYANVPPEWS